MDAAWMLWSEPLAGPGPPAGEVIGMPVSATVGIAAGSEMGSTTGIVGDAEPCGTKEGENGAAVAAAGLTLGTGAGELLSVWGLIGGEET